MPQFEGWRLLTNRSIARACCAMLTGNQGAWLMLVHIFRGVGRVFGFTEDSNGTNLPSQYGPWIAFKSMDLNRTAEPTPGVNTGECLDDIEKYGLYITDAHVRITERVV
jgi:hypothetical protein